MTTPLVAESPLTLTTDSNSPPGCTFTVFTPTWNRAHTLERVYSSLKEQTLQDFEWLVVDDGSEDDTSELIARWQEEGVIRIRYLAGPHRGLHHAYNTGVTHARGEFFLPIGSDDRLVPDALGRLYEAWEGIPEDQREGFTGVCCLCMDETGAKLGRFPQPVLDCTSQELRYRYTFTAETSGFHRTSVLRRFPFPDDDRIQFVPESIVWSAIARSYRLRCIDEPLRVYLRGEDSICTAVGTTRRLVKNCYGFGLHATAVLENELGWFRTAPLHFLRTAADHTRFRLHCRAAGIMPPEQPASKRAGLLVLLATPWGAAKYLRDRRRLGHTGSEESRA